MVSTGSNSGAHVRSVLFQLLRQCNYQCSHCSQAAPHVGDQHIEPLPVEIVKKRLDDLCASGLKRVRFTGGEPLLHPQLAEVVAYARSLGVDTSIVTNGALLRPAAHELVEAGLNAVWISLYGPNHDAYAEVAQRSAPVELLGNAIQTLSANGVRVGIYCTVDLSSSELDLSLLTELVSNGVTHVKFMQLMEQGRQLQSVKRPRPKLQRTALTEIARFRSAHSQTLVSVSMRSGQRDDFLASGFNIPDYLGCTAGMADSWSVGTSGDLKPCCLMMASEEPAGGEFGSGVYVIRRFPAVEIHRSVGDSAKVCPALPEYKTQLQDEFICPLAYATS